MTKPMQMKKRRWMDVVLAESQEDPVKMPWARSLRADDAAACDRETAQDAS